MPGDTSGRWSHLTSLLQDLLELEPAEQAERLAALHRQDTALAAELEELLRADRATGVLDEDIAGIAGVLISGMPRGKPAGDPFGELEAGDRVGPFRIVRLAGSGGMGHVYLAERADGEFKQRVALKLVRTTGTGDVVLQRFMEERQILAGLQHPHIAGLLDGGVTPAGVPWFAMEFVEGEPLIQYCDAARLTVPERLRLFLDVCAVVAYAHRNLIVHRDLKPANILVTAEGRVKLLDFGIARVSRSSGPDAPVTVQPWLTPEYASPEQVAGAAVSTASDVYSLGVILYELLCGRRPFQHLSGRPHLLARALMEEDPRPPSTTLPPSGGGDELESIASSRGTSPRRLLRLVRGDVDAIPLQALRRDPGDRYATVDALAADIRQLLAGRPVLARRGSRWYAVRRFVARNRAAVAGVGGAGVLALVFGVLHTTAVARERDVARAEASRAEEVSAFLVDLFSQSDPLGVGTGPRPVTEFLSIGTERLRHELATEPELRAAMFRVVGKVQENLGNFAEADSLFRAALELRMERLPPTHNDLVQSVQDLGALRRRQGEHDQADSLLADAMRRLSPSASPERRADLLDEIAEVRRQRGELDAADSILRAASDLRIAALGPRHPRHAQSLSSLGVIARDRGLHAEAEAYHREALAIRREHFGEDHAYVAESIRNLALVLHSEGRLADARAAYEEALSMQVRLLGESHPQLGPTRNSYGALLRTLGERDAALEQYRLVLELQRAALGDAHPRLATSITNFALVVRDLGDMEEADRLAREGLAMRIRLLGEDHASTAQSFNVIGTIARDAGRLTEAEEALERADRIYLARFGPEHRSVGINRAAMGFVALQRRDLPLAGDRFRSSLDIIAGAGLSDRMDAARPLLGMGRTLLAQDRHAEAAGYLREALRIQQANLPPEHPDIAETLADLLRAESAGAAIARAGGRP